MNKKLIGLLNNKKRATDFSRSASRFYFKVRA